MQSYTLILRNAHGRVVRRSEFGCAGDAEALGVARQEASGRAAELWRGQTRIAGWGVSDQRRARVLGGGALREPLPAPDGAAVIATTAEGLVSHWDRNAAALYGWSSREALGRSIVELTPAAQSRGEAAEVMSGLLSGQAWEGEMVLRRKDGALFRAFVLDVPVEGADGLLDGVVGVSLPIERGEEIRRARGVIEAELRRRFPPAPRSRHIVA